MQDDKLKDVPGVGQLSLGNLRNANIDTPIALMGGSNASAGNVATPPRPSEMHRETEKVESILEQVSPRGLELFTRQ